MEVTEYRLKQGEKQISQNTSDIVDLKILMAKQVEMEEEDRRRLDKLETVISKGKEKPAVIIEKVVETILVCLVSAIVSYFIGR